MQSATPWDDRSARPGASSYPPAPLDLDLTFLDFGSGSPGSLPNASAGDPALLWPDLLQDPTNLTEDLPQWPNAALLSGVPSNPILDTLLGNTGYHDPCTEYVCKDTLIECI